MNLNRYFLLCASLIAFQLLSACSNETESQTKPAVAALSIWEVPTTSGTEVASYTKKIDEDKLNDAHFEVKIYTTENSANKGTFEIKLASGPGTENIVEKSFPKWTANNVVRPMIKAVDSLKYGAIIGFDPGDGSFKELFLVNFKDNSMELNRLKSYSLAKTPSKK